MLIVDAYFLQSQIEETLSRIELVKNVEGYLITDKQGMHSR